MCADKLRRTAPFEISFSDAEQPTAQKLTAVASQARSALTLVEKAIGDVWNQGGDSITTASPLQIPNIARLIGQSRYLSPPLYMPTDEFTYFEYLGNKFSGETEGYLLFPPKNGSTFTVDVAPGSSGFTGSRQTNERDLSSDGDYYIDDSTGRFRTTTPIHSTCQVRYEVDPQDEWHVDNALLPTVIPDPRQADFTSVRIEKSGSVFLMHLPPRRPLTLASNELPANYPPLGGTEQSTNETSIVGVPKRLWQFGTQALAHEHYRYSLPKEILDIWSGLSEGQELPAGMFYLWNENESTIIDDVVFKVPVGKDAYTLQVSSATFDFDTVDTSDETEASYSNTNLQLITCATSLTRAIWSLSSAFYQHKHEKGSLLDSPVSHDDLEHLNPPTWGYAPHSARYPAYLPAWQASNWEYDRHTSLLSRAGAQIASSRIRDDYNNAMLGHMLLANADESGVDNFLDNTCPDDSFNLRFGDIDGNRLYCAASGIQAVARGGSDNHGLIGYGDGLGDGLYGSSGLGATAAGVYGTAVAYYGVLGETSGAGNYGVYGASSVGGGVRGFTSANGKYGVLATSLDGTALFAESFKSSGAIGAFIRADVSGGIGVDGTGQGIGVRGNSAAIGIKGLATSGGTGVNGESDTGWGIRAKGHASGGASGKAAFHIDPQDSDPSGSPSEGDAYVNDSTGKLRLYDGTNWNRIVHNVYSIAYTTNGDRISGVTTATAFSSTYTIPANALVVGSIIRIRAGIFKIGNNDVVDNIQVKLTGGSTGTIECINTSLAAITDYIVVDIEAVVRDISGSGSLSYSTQTVTDQATDARVGTSLVGTASGTIVVSMEVDPANASDSFDLYEMSVDIT